MFIAPANPGPIDVVRRLVARPRRLFGRPVATAASIATATVFAHCMMPIVV